MAPFWGRVITPRPVYEVMADIQVLAGCVRQAEVTEIVTAYQAAVFSSEDPKDNEKKHPTSQQTSNDPLQLLLRRAGRSWGGDLSAEDLTSNDRDGNFVLAPTHALWTKVLRKVYSSSSASEALWLKWGQAAAGVALSKAYSKLWADSLGVGEAAWKRQNDDDFLKTNGNLLEGNSKGMEVLVRMLEVVVSTNHTVGEAYRLAAGEEATGSSSSPPSP